MLRRATPSWTWKKNPTRFALPTTMTSSTTINFYRTSSLSSSFSVRNRPTTVSCSTTVPPPTSIVLPLAWPKSGVSSKTKKLSWSRPVPTSFAKHSFSPRCWNRSAATIVSWRNGDAPPKVCCATSIRSTAPCPSIKPSNKFKT